MTRATTLVARPFDPSLRRSLSAGPLGCGPVAAAPLGARRELTVSGGETEVRLSDVEVADDRAAPRLAPALNRRVSAFDTAEPEGRPPTVSAEAEIINNDGGVDSLLDYTWEGRGVEIFTGAAEDPADRRRVFTGAVETLSLSEERIRLSLRDRASILQGVLTRGRYRGTGDAEGPPELAHSEKPLLLGQAYNLTPTLLDAARQLYQVIDGRINYVAVYDRGAALRYRRNYATPGELLAASTGAAGSGADIEAGRFARCPEYGLLRLGGPPAGQVTVTANSNTAGNHLFRYGANHIPAILYQIVTTRLGRHSLRAEQIDEASFRTPEAAALQPSGVFYPAGEPIRAEEAIGELLRSIGAYYWFGRDGKFRFAELDGRRRAAPDCDHRLGAEDILGMEFLDSPPPVWRRRIAFDRNYTPQAPSELAAAAPTPERLAAEYRYAETRRDDTLSRYPSARDVTTVSAFNGNFRGAGIQPDEGDSTLLVARAAAAIAARMSNRFGVARRRLSLELAQKWLYRCEINDTVFITYPRYDLAAGKSGRVVAIEDNSDTAAARIEVWM